MAAGPIAPATLDPRAAERTYPLPGPIDIGQFTKTLYAVADALVEHGYPRPAAAGDVPELARALGRFVHGHPREMPRAADPLLAELGVVLEQVRVRALHTPSPSSGGDCATCRCPHPCRTRRTVDDVSPVPGGAR
jgi:hypothetical protein